MRTASYIGQGRIEPREAEPVEPGPQEVRIRVAFAGICGTDLHILHGHMDHRVSAPQPIGHEMSGTIESLGSDVGGLAVGQKVTVMPLLPCGDCAACHAGFGHVCQNLDFVGIETPGAMQELWTVPASIVIPLPVDIELAHAALIEPLAVAVHDVRRSRLTAGETAVVIGGGPIGQLIALVAARTGARVIVAEPNRERRELAARNGTRVVDPLTEDLAAVVDDATGAAGADVVFEVAGIAATVLDATSHAKVRGRVVMVAIHPNPIPVDLHRIFWRELEILGARVYEREDFERAVALIAAGEIPAGDIITDVVPLDHAARAFATLSEARAMKMLVDVRSDEGVSA